MKRILSVIIFAACCVSAYAQSVPFLLYNTDVRAGAMAAVGTEGLAAGNALSGKTLDVSASYSSIAPGSTGTGLIGLGGYGNIGELSVGLYGRYSPGRECELFNENAMSLGTFRPSDLALGASVAYVFAEKFAVGARASIISSKLSSKAIGSSLGIDVSAAYAANGLAVELAVRNLGPNIKYEENAYKLPSLAVAGVSYGKGGFSARAEAGCFFSGSFLAGIGIEYTIVKIVSLRAGFHYGDDDHVPTYASAGLGLQLKGFKLDFTYLPPLGKAGGAFMGGLGYCF